MNSSIRTAQLVTTGSPEAPGRLPPVMTFAPPAEGQSAVMLRQAGQLMDFRQIADADISYFRIGGDLQMIFANGGMTIVRDFFAGDTNAPVILAGGDQSISISQLNALVPVQDAEAIQTAAGEAGNLATALGAPTGSGQNFQDIEIDALGDGLAPSDLLNSVPSVPEERSGTDYSESEIDTVPEVIASADAGSLEENDLADGTDGTGPTSAAGSLGIDFGGNAGTDLSLTFDTSGGVPLDSSGTLLDLSSDGVALTYTIIDNSNGGQTLTAAKAGTGETVFTVVIEILPGTNPGGSAGAAYTFELFGNLDHLTDATASEIPVSFSVTAMDTDGDSITSSFTVSIADDEPVTGTADTTFVDEEGLAAGNADSGYDGDLAGTALTSSGDLAIDWGADEANRSVGFSDAQPGLTGLTSNGETVSIALLGDGTLVGYAGGTVPASTGAAAVVFYASLSEAGSGSYAFTLAGNLDHPVADIEDDLELTFAFTATDGDGDEVEATFTVTVDDDAPVIGSADALSVDEEGLSGNAGDSYPADLDGNGLADDGTADDLAGTSVSGSGSLGILWGADDADTADTGALQDTPSAAGVPGNRSVVFAGSLAGESGLTSDGQTVYYVLSDDGTRLIAHTGASDTAFASVAAADQVFTVGLFDDAAGTYSFTLLRNLDHATANAEDDVELTFAFVATDGDGDTATSSFMVTVDDDAPVIGTADAVSVDEEGLSGNAGDSYPTDLDGDGLADDGTADDLAGASVSQSGGLGIVWGSDAANTSADTGASAGKGDRAVTFLHTDSTAAAANVTVGGVTALTSRGDAVVFRLSNSGATLEGYVDGSPERVVFTVTLQDSDANGSYTFTLSDVLDHATANEEDDIELTFAFKATDSDGDTAASSFTVTVDDDAPVVDSTQNATVQLDDDDVSSSGNAGFGLDTTDGADSDDEAPANASGTLDHSYGADGAGSLVLLDTGTLPSGCSATLSSDRLTLTISQNGTAVLQIVLSNATSGEYTVTQLGAISHSGDDTEDNLEFIVAYRVTDGDGDTSDGTLTINVDDDTPVVDTTRNATVQLDDDDLTGASGNAGFGLDATDGADSDDEAPANASGTLDHSYGADGAGSLVLLDTGTLPSGCSAALSSDGLTLTISQNGTAVLQVVLSNATSGDYTVTQLGAISHSGDDTEDNLEFIVAYRVTDGDGDTSDGTLTINVDDDTPVVDSSQNATVQLDDDDLTGASGNAGFGLDATDGADSDDAAPLNAMGVLDHSYGTDGAGTLVLLDIGTLPTGFSSVLSNTGLTLTISQGTTAVLQIDLSDGTSGTYTVTQLAEISHSGDDTEDNLEFIVAYRVTDGDGDTSDGTLTINVDDDTPVVDASQNATVQLDDDDLTGASGNAGFGLDATDGADSDEAAPLNATGTLDHSYGADGAGSLVLLDTGTLPSGCSAVLSNGGLTLTISQGTTDVLQIDLNDDTSGDYTVTQLSAITHSGDDTEDNLEFTVAYQVTDGDGDTSAGTLTINADDDTPVVDSGQNATVQLDDDDVSSSGNAGFGLDTTDGVDSDDAAPANASGTLDHSYGADGTGSLVLLDTGTLPSGCSAALSSDGLTLTISQNGTAVLQIVLSDDTLGEYTVTQLGAIIHSGDDTEDNLEFVVAYRVTDGDGDTSDGTLTINVDDDTPVVDSGQNATVQLDDDDVSGSGNAGFGLDTADGADSDDEAPANVSGTLDHSYGADGTGSLVLLDTGTLPSGCSAALSSDGLTLTISQNGTAVLQIVLSNATSGEYTVTQLGAIIHSGDDTEDNLEFIVAYRVTDGDGDTSDGTLTVNVDDDTPVVDSTQNVTVQLDDDDVSAAGNAGFGLDTTDGADSDDEAPANANGTLDHSYGADGTGSLVLLDTGTLPSGCSAALSSDGLTLTISQNGTAVLQIVLSNATSGEYTVTQLSAISHSGDDTEDNLEFIVAYRVTDGDGDTSDGTLTVNVDDDTPVVDSTANDTVQLDDDDLNGNAGFGLDATDGVDSDDEAPANASGTLDHSYGADGTGSLVLLDTGTLPSGCSAALSSDGLTLTISQNGTAVLQVVLSDDTLGEYTVTQLGAITHSGDDTEDNLEFIVAYRVTDGDGDTSDGTLTINVDDDTPVVDSTANDTVQLDDDDLNGNAGFGLDATDGADSDDEAPANASGTLDHSFGADGAGSLVLLDTGTLPSGCSAALSSDGLTLTISQNGTAVLQAVLSNATSGEYTVTQLGAISHSGDDTEDNLEFVVAYRVTDGDGDTSDGTLTINVDDDTPVVDSTANDTVQLDDDDLNGNAGFGLDATDGVDSDESAPLNATGTLDHSYGADGAGSLVLLDTGTLPSGCSAALSSDGLTLTISQNGTAVLQVVLSNATSGEYTVTQLGAISHSGDDAEDNLEFIVAYRVTDGDGDTSDGTLTINVDDDTPVVDSSQNATVQLDDDDLTGASGNAGFGLDATDGADSDDAAPLNAMGVLDHSYGTDGAGTLVLLDTGTLPSGCSAALSSDGLTLTISQGTTAVLQIDLSDGTSGTYTVTQLSAITHSGDDTEDNLEFIVAYRVTDGDGDTSEGTLTINVDDDTPVVDASQNATVQLDDDDLTGASGNAGFGLDGTDGADSDDAAPANASGTLDHSYGADGAGSLVLLDTGTLPSDCSAALSSDGLTLTISQNGTAVLQIVLSNATSGEYTVTRLGAISHSGDDTEDNLEFIVAYRVTDGDGDTSDGTLTINVDDDTPVVDSTANDTVQLDDDDLNGNAGFGLDATDGVDSDESAPLNATGTLDHSYGADGAGSLVLLDTGTLPSGCSAALSSDGLTLTISQNGTAVLQIVLSNNTSGEYAVTQLAAISHSGDDTEDNLEFVVAYRVTDGDGDTSDGTLTVNVDDDTPVIGSPVQTTVSEDAITTSQSDLSLDIGWGADDGNPTAGAGSGDRSVAFASSLSGASGLTTNGLTVYYVLSDDATQLIAHTGGAATDFASVASVDQVFTIDLSDSDEGYYTFTLLQPLDHAAPTGSGQSIDLGFAIVATDADLDDSSTGSFTVTVDAAGSATASSIDYSGLSQAVFVNLDSVSRTVNGQQMDAETATDGSSVATPLIGQDSVSGIADAAGGSGSDILAGNDSSNTLGGNAGSDFLVGGGGNDIIDGGAGDDTVTWAVGDGSDTVDGGDAADTDLFEITGSSADETFYVETVTAFNTRMVAEGRDGEQLGLPTATEIVVSRAESSGASVIVAELANIDGITVTSGEGTDSLVVSGDFSGTDLDTAAISYLDGSGDDTLDLTDPDLSDHQVIFFHTGGDDTISGDRDIDRIDITGKTVTGVEEVTGGFRIALTDDSTGDVSTVTFTGDALFATDAGTANETIVNLVPVAENDTASGIEDNGSVSGNVLSNDFDANNADSLTVVAVTNQATVNGGTVTVGADGSYTYTPAADFNGTDTFTYTVQDGEGGSDTATVTVTVASVPDAPSGTDNTVTVLEDGSHVFSSSDFGFSDPNDSPADSFAALVITTIPATGTLTNDGAAVTAGDTVSAADIAAGKLVYTPVGGENGSSYASFTFQVVDDAVIGANGGENTDQSANTMTIDVTSVSDAPQGTDNTVTIDEDTSHTFAASDFGFFDPDDSPADSFSGVVIATLPSAGTLYLDGTAIVSTGATVSAADIAAGKLVFTPVADANGTAYASFTFQVVDDGSTANGGENTDASANTMTINVTAIADAATIGGTTSGSVTEDTSVSSGNLTVSHSLTVSDPDGSSQESFSTAVTFKSASHSDGSARGSLTITSGGSWTYTIGNSLTSVQDLDTGDSFTETFTVASADGTTQDITVTVNGMDESTYLDFDATGIQYQFFTGSDTRTARQATVDSASVEFGTSDTFLPNGQGWTVDIDQSEITVDFSTSSRDWDATSDEFVSSTGFELTDYNNQHADYTGVVLVSGNLTGIENDITVTSDKIVVDLGGYDLENDTTFTFKITTANGIADPLVFDLNGDGVDLSAMTSFDIDADGDKEMTGWAGPEDGLLVADLDGSGLIEDGSELFSEVFNGGSYADSLEALASLDENGDGVIDTLDTAFGQIMIWQDGNSDGVSQEGELKSLSDHGIAAIDLEALAVSGTVDGNTVYAEGAYIRTDGSLGAYAGVTFSSDNDAITGSAGADVLIGSATNNWIHGLEGDDILIGGEGRDVLAGGLGADSFRLSSLQDADIITDYDFDAGDSIDLSGLLASAFGPVGETIRVQDTGEGQSVLQVDLDGAGTEHTWQDAATLEDISIGDTVRVVLDTDGGDATVTVA